MAYSVGEIVNYDLFANLPAIGSTGVLYFAGDTNLFYLWTGVAYVGTVGATPRVVSSVGGVAAPSINCNAVDLYEVTALAQAVTSVTVTGTPVDGQVLKFRWKDSGTSRAITYGASFLASGAAALLATTVTPKTHMNNFQYDSGRALWISIFVDTAGY
jgi:hypothetical protein